MEHVERASADAQPPLLRLRSGTGAALIAATVLASMAGFLDASVVNVAVPAIARDLGTSLVALQWSLTGYLLTAALLLVVGPGGCRRAGRAGHDQHRPHRRHVRRRRRSAAHLTVETQWRFS
jgi:MFS family permease